MLDEKSDSISYPKSGFEISGPWGKHPASVLSDGYRATMLWVMDFIDWLIYAECLIDNPDIGGILLNSGLYGRKSIKDNFFFYKGAPFYGKCIYCEGYITDFQRGDVEHFRPKGEVHDENDNEITHPGYYWLAYDMTNLVPSCLICNQASSRVGEKIGKRNRFPVEGNHVRLPAEIPDEKPLLINPASGDSEDDPAKHLKYDEESGFLASISNRGDMCIEVFGLNIRDQLVESRLSVHSRMKVLVLDYINKPNKRLETLAKIKKHLQGKHAYTLAARTAFKQLKPQIQHLL